MVRSSGRKTVSSWLRAIVGSEDWQDHHYLLQTLGCSTGPAATQSMLLAVRQIPVSHVDPYVKRAIDDVADKTVRSESRAGRDSSQPHARPVWFGMAVRLCVGHDQRGQSPAEGRPAVRSFPAFRKMPKRTTVYLREQQTVPKSTGSHRYGWRSDPRDNCETTLEAVADGSAIEQNFHDVKAVYGSGQQQVRNVWCNVACWNLCLWLHTLVELWSWRHSGTPLKQRGERPWDEPSRRPCHTDRFKTLRKHVLRESFSRLPRLQRQKRKIQSLFKALTRLAT